MDGLVEQKLKEILEVFEGLSHCKVETNVDDQLVITIDKPVLWSDSLEKEDAESTHKIGTIKPHKASLGLYIDFPHGYLDIEKLEKIINPEETLTYYPPGTKAPTVKSWWRFRSDEKFDSLHLVLRKIELAYYNFKREDWIDLMREITEAHE
ncbi:hypothetical protein A1A1_13437 [Planococcus antarcticus DSM 14505]|uniref:Uncharacterized protein n=1 Tax=Planococcus antarcticus DSM 14505 TaxID=1185653 RepID=A0A1C7DK51_9BACL|nr:hypothetical protein [Planococcus antarcticus]ANU11960.1 hypothetical protein BBH88_17725 [Planococcus antarcticus DSM 14505]EIM05950.1 hypothetical protein A1A1_13437 [Planococcus antarcticus DSM 14505]